MRGFPGALLIIGALLAACSPSALQESPSPTALSTAEASTETTPDPNAAVPLTLNDPEVTPSAPIAVRVWLPEPLAPVDREDAAELLSEQISGFLAENPDLLIDLRLKRPSDEGGILETLRSASAVAPDALPDVTLVRRADLVAAVEGGYLEPIQNSALFPILDGIPPAGLELGQVENQLFGVPYALDLWHTAYPVDRLSSTATIDGIIETGLPFVFPANRATPTVELLIAQIVGAGGVFGADGLLSIDRDALIRIFAFYEDETQAGTISSNVLTYADSSAYADLMRSQEVIGVVNAHVYQEWIAQGARLSAGLLPTLDGAPITILDGWMWVIVTGDAERQAAVVRLITWMMQSERQNRYTDLLYLLPSSHDALALRSDTAYAALIESLWSNAVSPLNVNSPAGRALHASLIHVLNGELSAQAAAEEVLVTAGSG